MDERPYSGDKLRRDTPVLNREPDESFLSTSGSEIVIGQLIENRFKVLSLLGTGGMGSVYLVEQIDTHKRYALKTLLAAQTTDRTIRRFQQEANATSILNHPNLVRLHAFGLIHDEHPYFVMDYCEGETLAERIKADGPLPVSQALGMFIAICGALAYAHSQGVVHRDLKPSNIMITVSGAVDAHNVRVLDFGIAKVLREATGAEFNTLTRTGEVFGSPYYMSPEQCMGKEIDSRSDIYSLGCVFFEILTGTTPFLTDNALTTMLKHQSELAPSLKEATLGQNFCSDLETIISRMLAKNPDDRYQDMLGVQHDLRCIQKGEPLGLTDTRARMSRTTIAYIGIALGAIILAGSILLYFLQPSATIPVPRKSVLHMNTAADHLPSVEQVRAESAARKTSFYTDLNQASRQERRFHFPAQPIGKIGSGITSTNLVSAVRDLTLQIPVNFYTEDPSVLSGFRDNEVGNLAVRGILIDDVCIERIKRWRELEVLDFSRTDVSDQSITILQGFPKLISLTVEGTHISATGLRQLHLEKMRVLNVNHIPFASELLQKLGHNSINRLSMDDTGLKDSDLKIIGGIPSLIMLDISNNDISDKGLTNLVNLHNLTNLFISSKHITPRSVDSFKKMTQLRGLFIKTYGWTPAEKASFKSALKRAEKELSLDVTMRE